MVAVAYDAPRKTCRLKRCFVRALFVHLVLENMARGANVLHGADSGRCGPMITVASRASRRAQVATNCHRFVVNAGAVLGKLVCGNLVSFHVFRIRMTAGTSLRYIQRVHFRPRVAGRA